MFRKLILATLVVCTASSIRAQVTDSMRLTGMEVKVFESKVLGEKRKIRIQLPAGMNAWDKYPVLYVLDGEAQTGMVAGQVQYLTESYKIIPSLIIVGIDNTDRTRDLTPTHSIIGQDGKPDTSANAFGRTSGGGEKFLQFIQDELKPYIERNYHPAPYSILTGHSLGALLAVHCLIHHPAYYNAYIAISPSLQWDDKALLKQAIKKISDNSQQHRMLFFTDANEDSAFHQNQLELKALLDQKKSNGLVYSYAFYPGETHTSEPVKAFYDGIRFVYPNWHLPYNSSSFKKTMNYKVIKDHYEELSKKYNYTTTPLHDEFILIARFLRNDPGRIGDAVSLLQWGTLTYPQSVAIWETLGDTYMKQKDVKNARTAYQKGLEIELLKTSLQQKIKNLEGMN